MTHSRNAFIATLFAPIVALVACSRESAAPAVSDAAPAVVSVPTASVSAAPLVVNEAKITRYKDEASMTVPVTVKHSPAAVLTAMPKGDVVAQLKVGDAVTQLAERNGYYRVTFADPTNAKQLLSGWLDKFAFIDRPTPPKKKVPTCTGDLILVMQGDMRCAKTCSDDAECPGGDCDVAAILHADGQPPENSASTTVCTPKAAPAPSASASASASAAPSASAPVKAKPKTTSVGVNVADMMCPNGYMQMQKVMCMKFCKSDDDCGTSEKCKDAGGQKICS